MRLVEVVGRGADQRLRDSSHSALSGREGSARCLSRCGDDTGFILNRLLVPYLNDAARICAALQVDWSVADAAVRDELGHPMGPFELMDLIGLDVMVLGDADDAPTVRLGSVRACTCVGRAGCRRPDRTQIGRWVPRLRGERMSTVTSTSSESVATITLQRPESLNALDLAYPPGAPGCAHQRARRERRSGCRDHRFRARILQRPGPRGPGRTDRCWRDGGRHLQPADPSDHGHGQARNRCGQRFGCGRRDGACACL